MQNLNKYGVTYYEGKAGGVIPYFLFHRPGQPIHIKVSFLAGSRFDTKPGIAHFLEHMILAGSRKYPNKRILSTTLENLGGMVGGSTNLNMLTIKAEIAEKNDLAIVFDVLNEVINQPLFDETTIETERGSILTEEQIGRQNRSNYVLNVYETLAFQGTPMGKRVIGTEESIKSITKSDLIDFYNNIFKNNPVVWSISGDIEEKDILDILPKIYKPEIELKSFFSEKLPQNRAKIIAHEIFDDLKTDLVLGFRTDPAKTVDFASLDIILTYLALNRGCKLQEELRYKRGLIYGIYGFNDLYFDVGDWSIVTSYLADKTQEILDIITSELQKIKIEGIPLQELELVKSRIIKGNISKKQTAESWSAMGSSPAFISSPEKFLISNYEEAIEKATPEDIIAVANRYFTADNWYLAICGPETLKNIKVSI